MDALKPVSVTVCRVRGCVAWLLFTTIASVATPAHATAAICRPPQGIPSGSPSQPNAPEKAAAAAIPDAAASAGAATATPADRQLELRIAAARQLLDALLPARDDPDATFATLLDPIIGRTAVGESILDLARPRMANLRQPAAAIPRFERFLASNPHPLAADTARAMLTDLLVRLGKPAEAKAIDAYSGYLRRVLAIGPLGDDGDYYNRIRLQPEIAFPRHGETLAGRSGPVGVRIAERSAFTARIDLAGPAAAEGCYYGLFRFRNDAPLVGYVEVLQASSYEVFLDGVRIAERNRFEDRNQFGARRYAFRAGIAPRDGRPHQLLIKLTEGGSSRFAMRLVGANGEPLPGVREVFDEPIDGFPPSDAAELPPLGGSFVGGIEALERAAARLGNAETEEAHAVRIATALMTGAAGTHARALRALRAVDRTPPPVGPLALAHAAAIRSVRAVPEALRVARAAAIEERVHQTLPNHHAAAMRIAAQRFDRDQREDAIRMLQDRVTRGLAGPETLRRLHDYLQKFGARAEATAIRRRLLAAYPGDGVAARAEAAWLVDHGQTRAALEILRNALAIAPSTPLRRQASALARSLGERALAEALAAEIHAANPDRSALREELAFLSLHLEDREASARAYEAVAKHPDARPSGVRRSADALLRAGRTDAAIAAYRRALTLDPTNDVVRRTLARLQPSGPEATAAAASAELEVFHRDAMELVRAFRPGKAEATAPSTLALCQVLVSVADDGSAVQRTHTIRRINDRRGVEEYQDAESAANSDQVLELRTIVPVPSTADDADDDPRFAGFRPTRVDDSYAMPRLEPGAFVEELTVDFIDAPESEPLRIGPHYLQFDAPCRLNEVIVVVPPGLEERTNARLRLRNVPTPPEKRTLLSGRVAYVVRNHDSTRIASERRPPPWSEVLPVVAFGQDRPLGAYERAQHASAVFYSAPTPIVDEIVAETRSTLGEGIESSTDGAEAPTDRQLAAALWQQVCERIAGDEEPADATYSLLEKKGSRLRAFGALLRSARIPFEPALVARTSDAWNSAGTSLFGGDFVFDIEGLRIAPRGGGAPIWHLASAARHQPLGMVAPMRVGAPALVFPDFGTARIDYADAPRRGDGFAASGSVVVDENGRAEFAARVEVLGPFGYMLADRVRTVEDNVVTLISRRLVGQMFRGWGIRNVALLGRDRPGEAVRVEAKLRKRRALTENDRGELLETPLAASRLFEGFGGRGEREFPLHVADSFVSSHDLVVDVGPQRRVLRVPDPVLVRRMLCDFELRYEVESPQRLRIRHRVAVRPGRIPSGMFAEWTRLLQRLDSAERQRIAVGPR